MGDWEANTRTVPEGAAGRKENLQGYTSFNQYFA